MAVVGSGYVGLVTSACLAELGHRVVCVESDEARVRILREGGIPIHEKYLPELLSRHRAISLDFTTDLKTATRRSQVIIIAVGTPEGPGGGVDVSCVDAAAREIARSIDDYKVIVEKSTVPVYTSDCIRRSIEEGGVPGELFDVASNPEFLREGTAVADFLHPDRIVLGVENERASQALGRIYEPLISGLYYQSPEAVPGPRTKDNPPSLLLTSTKAAEIIKHASNAFLATKISFINVIANICEAAGADVVDVARGIGLDSRIGAKYLRPGLGYGGSCLPKDVAAFRCVAEQLGVDFSLLQEVERINERQKSRFFQKLHAIVRPLRDKKIGALGLAFKGGTDDIRESPALDIVRQLLHEGVIVAAYDPAARGRAEKVIPPTSQIRYVEDPYSAAQDADALVILNDCQEFAELNLERLHGLMRYPVIVDGRNLYNPAMMKDHGFVYSSMGRSVLSRSGS